MTDYSKKNASLIINKIRDVDIGNLFRYIGQAFLTLEMALPVTEIFESRKIVVPVEVTIEISFSKPGMLKWLSPWPSICKFMPIS